ncbi:hypothetical protein [Limosilactobacillus fermentum]
MVKIHAFGLNHSEVSRCRKGQSPNGAFPPHSRHRRGGEIAQTTDPQQLSPVGQAVISLVGR